MRKRITSSTARLGRNGRRGPPRTSLAARFKDDPRTIVSVHLFNHILARRLGAYLATSHIDWGTSNRIRGGARTDFETAVSYVIHSYVLT